MAITDNTRRLGLYESLIVAPVAQYDAGFHTFRIMTAGNSILSTLWVKSIDVGASVVVKWYDIGPGSGDYIGEKVYTASHAIITTADTSDRKIVPRIHNRAFCEIEVIGGNAVFGVYATVVSDFPQQAPYLDAQSWISAGDGGNANAILDMTDNKFYLARGKNGVADINVVSGTVFIGFQGSPLRFRDKIEADGTLQTIINEIVPSGKKWRLLSSNICSRVYGVCDIIIDGNIINSAVTGPSNSNVSVVEQPYYEILEGQTLEVKFKKNYGPVSDVSIVIQIDSITI
jgi:hypothetical protein